MGLPDENKRQKNFPSGKASGKNGLLANITAQNISSGLISSTLVMTGPVIIILEAATSSHFTAQQTINWMFAVYFFGGLFGILMPLAFRIPITGGHSITGVAFLATVTSHFTYPQLIGGYVISGLLIFLVGISGSKTWIPKIPNCTIMNVIDKKTSFFFLP
ncbi:benzoate/H(+) symporter BenE family transporter [Ectobacillus funiculus]|uniref:benzoate/H(+) symporter BenE family transporter n=1 Tax=Ectobacillus funiculus TaxID=137993 RepID=UPI00397AB724